MPPFSFPLPALGAALGAQNRARSEERLRREDEVRQSLRKTLQNLEEPLNHHSAPSQTMTEQHPITPGPSQLDQWEMVARATTDPSLLNEPAIRAGHFGVVHRKALRLAFAAGADQELEACCEWLSKYRTRLLAADLRYVRRPNPPSLKEQALAALNEIEDKMLGPTVQEKLIRRALESIND